MNCENCGKPKFTAATTIASGSVHTIQQAFCMCGEVSNYTVTAREDQPRPVIQATSDSQPRHLEEWEKPNWNRAPEAQGATCPNCKSDDPLMCKVPIKEFHRHMGEAMLCCPNKFHPQSRRPAHTEQCLANRAFRPLQDDLCTCSAKCECSEKDAAVCRSMPQHQPEYCRVKGAVAPLCKKCGQPKTEMRVITGKGKSAHIGSYKCWPCANEEAENNAAPDPPPQIVSAPADFWQSWIKTYPQRSSYYVDAETLFQVMAEYASSSNAALQEELQYVLEDWNMLVKASGSPTNGAAIGYVAKMRRDLEAAESKLKDAANEIHMLERAAESHKYTVADLVAERDGLREALRKYGNHRIVCTVHMWMGSTGGPVCNCGWEKAVANLGTESTRRPEGAIVPQKSGEVAANTTVNTDVESTEKG